ncbi:hypothetical protein AALP_AA7G057200 [Arabis alpina]|uniref:Uncharacterized protein n=1 Tax=Arabis alpina TaxID=50452 RepID=A0A087GG53_ARAAL|nr:hypothetical protein AALP_AA7G057200 [Arabis alpina]
MGKRSFRELASGSACASKAIAPPSTTSVPRTTATPSSAPDLAHNTTSVPSTTPAPSTTSSAKKPARMPSSIVLGMPASDPKAFLAFVNRVGHELEAEIEKQKHRADAYAKGELAAKTERNKYAELLENRDKELEKALGDNKRLRALIVDLHEQFAIAKAKFEELKGDPQDKLVFQIQREANLDFVKQLLGLFPDRKVPRLEDELASLIADVDAHAGDEEYFDKLMESLGECLDVVLPEFAKPTLPNRDMSLEKLAADAGVANVSGSHMESARGLLQEMRIDSVGLLKNLMISEDGRMSFAGEDETEVTMVAAEGIEVEKTKTGEDAVETETTVPDVVGAEKAASKEAELTTLVTSSEAGKDEEAHP